jgi:hypothetical protein
VRRIGERNSGAYEESFAIVWRIGGAHPVGPPSRSHRRTRPPGIGKYPPTVPRRPMDRCARRIAGLVLPLVVVLVLSVPSGSTVPPPGDGAFLANPTPLVRPAATEYVNLTDLSSNWASDFYSVVWPVGPFSAIRVEMTLLNFGDPWDRADWVDMDNVTLMDVTTLENSSGNNAKQVYSANVTEYEHLFDGPGHVWWQAMPDWIAACDAGTPGCWSGVLSFQFVPGPAPPGLPEVVPVLPFTTLTSTASAVNGTLRVNGSYARAEAVIFQEGQGTDEFWYVQSFAARELLWQWNNQTVLAMVPIPFINSGGALGGIDNLAEWNGTPAPGTGARPAVTADLTPWVGLLNRTPWYNFTVVGNANSWQIGLALFLWRATETENVTLATDSVNRSMGAHAAWINGHVTSTTAQPFASEVYSVNWSEYLNTSGTTIDLATGRTIVDTVVSSSLMVVTVAVHRTVFDVRVDGTGAVHILDLANWTNSTRVTGNAQDASLSEVGDVVWAIDGASAGLSSTERRDSAGTSSGNYSAPEAAFVASWATFANRTSKDGVGSSAPPAFLRAGVPVEPLPGLFVVAPAAGSSHHGAIAVELLTSPESVGPGSVSFGNLSVEVPSNDTVRVNEPSNVNGTFPLNVTSTTISGIAELEIPLEVTGWEPPYVAPLSSTATVAAAAGEAPWPAAFNGSAAGGTVPYHWQWSFGDGGTATGQTATHVYSRAGFFTAMLNVTDSKGRVSSSIVGVQVLSALQAALVSSVFDWSVGSTATVTAIVEGGLGPMNFSWGSLPTGCSLAPANALTCRPTAPGSVSLHVEVSDSLGYTAGSWLNTTIAARPAPPASNGSAILLYGGIVGGVAVLALVAFRLRGRRPRSP